MKKITLLKIIVLVALIFTSSIGFAQIVNTTELTGEDIIFYEDGNGAFSNPTGATITETLAPLATTRRSDFATDGPANELKFTRPTNTHPDGGATDPQSYRFRGNDGSANYATDIWIIVNSVDLSSYDAVGTSKYFTFSSKSEFREDNSTNIETDTEVFYTTGFTSGSDPTAGGVTWTKFTAPQITSIGTSPAFGADGSWTTQQIDLSGITAGTSFAIAFRRQTTANGPNLGETDFSATTNRNGNMLIGDLLYTGTTAKTAVTPGAFATNSNESAGGQTNIFDTPTAAINAANFSNTSWTNLFTTASTFTPRFDSGVEAPAGEGYKFSVASNYGQIAISEVTVEINRVRPIDGTSGGVAAGAVWKMQASTDDTNWDDVSENFDSTEDNHQVNTTIKLSTSKPYRHYRFVLVNAWTPNNAFASLRYITFKVASVWNGTNNDITDTNNYNTDTQPGTTEIIVPNTVSNYPTVTTTVANEITLRSGASFVTQGAGTVSGTFNFERNLIHQSGNTNGWYLVGSPIVTQTYDEDFIKDNKIASGTGTNLGIASYNNGVASGNWVYAADAGAATTGTITGGVGYSIKTSATKNVKFTGSLNTVDPALASITVGAGTPFNLIANPFASHINSQTFLDLAANSTKLTSKTIWVWNSAGKNYDTKLSTDAFMIAPGQGFFVSAVSAGNLEFSKSNQAHIASNTFQKSTSISKVKLNVTNGEFNRYAEVRYNTNATKGFDNGYDGERFTGVSNSFDVFTQLLDDNNGKNYQIQSLPNSDLESMIVPVGLLAKSGDKITFTAETLNLPNDAKVFLEDREKSLFTRLDNSGVYKISLSSDLSGVGRFYLHNVQNELSTVDVLLENVSIYKSGSNQLKIVGLKQGKASIKMFNMLGKQVMHTRFEASETNDISLPKLANGVYIVQLRSNEGKLNKKIILQ